MIWFTIFTMAGLVFVSRYLFLEPRLPVVLSERVQRLLSYSAPAVFSAVLAPIVLIDNNQLSLSFANSYLVGASIAIALAYFTRNTLLTVLVSMGIFFLILT